MAGRIVRIALLILFIIFTALYFSANAGLIDYQAKHKTELTEQGIKEFENDIKNNVNIDLKKYVKNDEDECDNALSRGMLKISNSIGEGVKGILDFFFKKIEKTMNN